MTVKFLGHISFNLTLPCRLENRLDDVAHVKAL